MKRKGMVWLLLAALAGNGGLFSSRDHEAEERLEDKDILSAFVKNAGTYRALSLPGVRPRAARTFERIADPESGRARVIYYSDCDRDHMRADFRVGGKDADFSPDDLAGLRMFFNLCAKGSESSFALFYEAEPGVPYSFISVNPQFTFQKSIYRLSVNSTGATGVTADEGRSVGQAHEKGHAYDYLLGGMPAGLDHFQDVWREATADAFAILVLTRDSDSLYLGGFVTQWRMAQIIPRESRDGGVIAAAHSYFNPSVWEASLKKASEMLFDGSIRTMSDLELAKIARDIARTHILPQEDLVRMADNVDRLRRVLGRLLGEGRHFAAGDIADAFAGLGRSRPQDRLYASWAKQAYGFFQRLETQEGQKATVSGPASLSARMP